MRVKNVMSYLSLVLLPVLFVSCASSASPERSLLGITEHAGPEQALNDYFKVYDTMKSQGVDTSNVRLEIEKLADKYPRNVEVLQRNAELAFEHKQLHKSANFLDRAYRVNPSLPDAAVLRSRIALAEGNKVLSKEIINRQIKLTPDHPGLYEALAGTLYFEKKYEDAERALENAYKLGAPRPRINYHLGLVAEAQGDRNDAIKHYQEALNGDASLKIARHRLAALKALSN